MRHSGTWLSGGLGSIGLTVGLGDLKGVFQPKRFSAHIFGTSGPLCPLGFAAQPELGGRDRHHRTSTALQQKQTQPRSAATAPARPLPSRVPTKPHPWTPPGCDLACGSSQHGTRPHCRGSASRNGSCPLELTVNAQPGWGKANQVNAAMCRWLLTPDSQFCEVEELAPGEDV